MKNFFCFLLMAGPMIIACKKDCVESNGMVGKWEWVQSYGGLIGQTLTPQSEGYTKHLEISDDRYKEFRNDSIVFESTYELETRPDTFFGTNTYILFGTGYELAVLQNGDDLKLIEICFDCYEHTYERK